MIFKYPKDYHLTLCMHPLMVSILGYAAFVAQEMDLPFVVTDTVSDLHKDKKLGRTSASHREGRAADISLRGWTTDDIDNFKLKLEQKFGKYGAISSRDNQRRLVVVHTGTAPHIHLQIDRKYQNEDVFPVFSQNQTDHME